MDLTRVRALLPEFKRSFLETDEGREHLAWVPRGRLKGRENFAAAVRMNSAGQEITDFVLTQLLPHQDTPHNRARGAWCCIAPVVTRDIRQWFEGSQWATPGDWPHIAKLILRFVTAVTTDASRLAAECDAFRDSEYSKGFQSGFLSPILNAVKPEEFVLVNSKTKRAMKELAGLDCKTQLRFYAASNSLMKTVVSELGADVPEVDVEGVLPSDVVDAFCHWWVSVYRGDEGENVEDQEMPRATPSGTDLTKLFPNATDRRRLCELMAVQIQRAHAQSASCWEITARPRRVRLNVGRNVALEFTKGRLRIGLVPEDVPEGLRDQLQREDRWGAEFVTTPVTRLCAFEPERYWALESQLEASAVENIRVAAQTGLQTPFHRSHSPEFLDYLEQELGRPVPRPVFQLSTSSKPAIAVGGKTPMLPAVRFDPRQTLFHRIDYTVGHLVGNIALGDLGLPELQRPFVWDRSKVRDLFDSMFRGFPVGFLLLWSNAQMQSGKQIGTDSKQIKVPAHLVVDGQQRLTSLYAVLKGATVYNEDFSPTKIEIGFRPRDGRFEVADAAIKRDPEFISNISDLWNGGGAEHRFVNEFLARLRQSKDVTASDEDVISGNISRLQNLVNYQLSALVVQPDVPEESVADIFVRTNNQGVKLNQADFILTLLSVFWPEGRRQLEEFSRQSQHPSTHGAAPSPFNYLIQAGPDAMLKAVIGVGFHRGRMKAVYQILRGRDPETDQFVEKLREAQFERLRNAQLRVLNLNDWHDYLQTLRSAGFLSEKLISSENSVIYSYVLFLIGRHQCKVGEPALSRLIRRWFVAVTLSARYSASSETTMDRDLADVRNLEGPDEFIEVLDRKIETTLTPDFWTIGLPAALDTSSTLAPQLLAFRAAQVVLSAPVLFSDRKVRDLVDPAMRPTTKAVEVHHLFPKAWLKRHGITAVKRINQAANFTLLEWPKNRNLSDLPPAEYVPRVRKEFTPAQFENMQYLHALPSGWEEMEYQHFLAERRKAMSQLIRHAYLSLSPSEGDEGLSLADANSDEREVWPLVEAVEQRLRTVVREGYDSEWGGGAEGKIASVLGSDAMVTIEKNRAKHQAVYRAGTSSETADTLDYCYLGQLGQLMVAGPAWKLFQAAFRDKRELEDLLKAVIPVRNDLAHFRRVPAKELHRCRVAADDLLVLTAKLRAP